MKDSNSVRKCLTKEIPKMGGSYFADEDGNIYSIFRSHSCGGQIIPLLNKRSGYLQAGLSINGMKVTRRLHRLIAETFIPNPLNLPKINHKNGVKTDNRRINLEWCTQAQNIWHAQNVLKIQYGKNLYKRGEEKEISKLKESDLYELYHSLINKGKRKDFADKKGITVATIGSIITGKTWGHLNIDWSKFKKIKTCKIV